MSEYRVYCKHPVNLIFRGAMNDSPEQLQRRIVQLTLDEDGLEATTPINMAEFGVGHIVRIAPSALCDTHHLVVFEYRTTASASTERLMSQGQAMRPTLRSYE